MLGNIPVKFQESSLNGFWVTRAAKCVINTSKCQLFRRNNSKTIRERELKIWRCTTTHTVQHSCEVEDSSINVYLSYACRKICDRQRTDGQLWQKRYVLPYKYGGDIITSRWATQLWWIMVTQFMNNEGMIKQNVKFIDFFLQKKECQKKNSRSCNKIM